MSTTTKTTMMPGHEWYSTTVILFLAIMNDRMMCFIVKAATPCSTLSHVYLPGPTMGPGQELRGSC